MHPTKTDVMSMEMPTHLPLALVMSPQALPQCCTRHGQPVAKWRRTVFTSRPPSWAWAVSPLLQLAIQSRIPAPAWPYCRECVSTRRRRLAYAYAAGTTWFVLSMGIGIGVMGTSTPAGPLSAVIVSPILTLLIANTASWLALAGGAVTGNGTLLTIAKPAPNFVASLPPLPTYVGYPGYQAFPGYPTYPPYPVGPGYPVQPAAGMPPYPHAPSAPPQ